MLGVEGLCFSYGRQQVLKDVQLQLPLGQLVYLLGANGAGKTTLLRLLLGHLKPDSGSIRLKGSDMSQMSLRQRAARLSYVPQNHDYSYDFKVADMVLMGRSRFYRWYQRPGRGDVAAMQGWLERLGILPLQDRLFCSLSGGERQLVLLARALFQEARIILMDEASANLDLHHQLMVMKMAKRLSREGYLVLVATHQMEWAFRYADRLLVMEDGGLTSYQDLSQDGLLQQLSRIYACQLQRVVLEDGQRLILPSADTLAIPEHPIT